MPLVFLKWRVGEAVNTYAFHAYIHGFKSRTRHQLCLRPVDNKSGATPQVERLYVAVRNSIYQFEIEGDIYKSDVNSSPVASTYFTTFLGVWQSAPMSIIKSFSLLFICLFYI